MSDKEIRLQIVLAVLRCVESGVLSFWNAETEIERAYTFVKSGGAGCKLDLTITGTDAGKSSV